jgi:antirestriction protein ArdC
MCGGWAHEHIHLTGHKTRLDRDLKSRFDQDAYAFEELVAEIGAAMTCPSASERRATPCELLPELAERLEK